MKNCMITFRSVTPAQRAEEFLRGVGVDCTVQRTPKYMEQRGCGYSLRLDCREVMSCTMLLRRYDIPFQKVYSLGDKGTPEELRL